MSCNDRISDRCAKKVSAVCTTYEGTLVRGTSLTGSCLNMEAVVEDLNLQIEKILDNTTLSDLTEACIDYNVTGLNITVKEAIKGLNDKVCELITLTRLDSLETASTCVDPCTTPIANGLVYHSFAVATFPLTVVGTWKSGVTTTDQYSTNLQHVIPSAGKYKFTVEVNGEMAASSTARIGVGVNAAAPLETGDLAGYFSSALITEELLGNTTYTFIKDLAKGDSVAVKLKLVSGTQFQANSIKLISEKVG